MGKHKRSQIEEAYLKEAFGMERGGMEIPERAEEARHERHPRSRRRHQSLAGVRGMRPTTLRFGSSPQDVPPPDALPGVHKEPISKGTVKTIDVGAEFLKFLQVA